MYSKTYDTNQKTSFYEAIADAIHGYCKFVLDFQKRTQIRIEDIMTTQTIVDFTTFLEQHKIYHPNVAIYEVLRYFLTNQKFTISIKICKYRT